jgi:WS/DGAT/MGAT family acyltransferase
VPSRPPLPFDAPFTSFNQPLSVRRTFARASLPLAPVRRLKEAWSCTLNDVVLALVASALRRYLLERGEACDAPLVAAMPLSTADAPHLSGNHLSNTFVALPVHLADPIERLLALRSATASVKQVHERLGRDMMGRWLDFASATGLRAFWAVIARRFMPPPINLVVSNVRGPERRRWLGGSPIQALWSVGPVLERIGLNVTVWSYADRMYVGVLSCPRNVPWPAEIAEGVVAALEELVNVGLPRPVPSPNEPVPEETFAAPTGSWLDDAPVQ